MSPNLGDWLAVLRRGGEWNWGRGQRKGSQDFQVVLRGRREWVKSPDTHWQGRKLVSFQQPALVSTSRMLAEDAHLGAFWWVGVWGEGLGKSQGCLVSMGSPVRGRHPGERGRKEEETQMENRVSVPKFPTVLNPDSLSSSEKMGWRGGGQRQEKILLPSLMCFQAQRQKGEKSWGRGVGKAWVHILCLALPS